MPEEKTTTQKIIAEESNHADADEKEKINSISMPLIAVRGNVAFPSIEISLDLARSISVKAFGTAGENHSKIFLVTQKNLSDETPGIKDLYKTGTICKIKRAVRNPDGNLEVTFEGICRGKLISLTEADGYLVCEVMPKNERFGSFDSDNMTALMQEIGTSVGKLRQYMRGITEEFAVAATSIHNPGMFADFVASGALFNYISKQAVLECLNPSQRLEKLAVLLQEELELAECEYNIHSIVKEKVEQQHKDFYLREQMKAIQQELGEDDDEISELQAKIKAAKFPKEITEKLEKELGKLAKTPFGAAESTVIRNYIETCLEVPFVKMTKEKTDVTRAEKILNADHDGLDKVKERILEYIAVKHVSPEVKNQTICLIGAPGVGKTSIARSIADAMGRKYVRVSLGGIRDEADIRGHRKTYIGAMPGRIIEALTKAKVRNPLIVLDEIDKLTCDSHGDPSSALLEVLDPEQNRYFRDHFIELPVDLSDCIFIATANGYDGIPTPLLDRMEVIEVPSYSRNEKLAIAKNHLIPKQMKAYMVSGHKISFTDDAVLEIIDEYTKEAGVRTLERKIASVIRKAIRKMLENNENSIKISANTVKEFLGGHRITPEKADDEDMIGVVNGLAFTQAGGDLLKIEVAVMPGTGKLELTGSLGDVMRESAKIAYSYVRSISEKLGIDTSFYNNKDLHVHCPEGAVPKDGPSAGVTMMCAMVSALTKIPVRHDVAMTGELSLVGRVMPIGGLREKTMAAYAAGVRTVLIPEKNRTDLEEADAEVMSKLNFVFCKTADDVLKNALTEYPVCEKSDKNICPELTAVNQLNSVASTVPMRAKQHI